MKDGGEQYIVDLPAQGTPGAYKMNGYIYKLNVSKGGAVNPGDYSDLVNMHYNGQLAISSGNYWIAPVNAATNVAATDINFDTICPEGWHVPTEDEEILSSLENGDYWLYMDNWSTAVGEGWMRIGHLNGGSLTIKDTFASERANVRCVRAK